ncbi:fimbrial assembly protein [Deinococcus taeanensis]|uniref:fimbrial assembly protein n=1 Tax=Deinococcus taeanensis TaxID=2737050 RepID=UPI001CDCBCC1|nr:fimbrial assembly protein [Deinococcus taeanensis]UBV41815.1 fimbrial assembly protein [Deinococcus taeanensis]
MVEVNLLPQQYRKQSEPTLWQPAAVALVVLTALIIGGIEVVSGTQIGNLRKDIDSLNGEVAALTPADREFSQLTLERTQLTQITAIATQLRDAKTYWTNDLAAFTAQLPSGSGVALSSMTIRPLDAGALGSLQQTGVYSGKNVTREIELTGKASSQQAVVNFLRTFENNPSFGLNFRNLQQEAEANEYTFNASVGIVQAGTAPQTPVTPGATPAAPATPDTSQGGGNVN